MYHFKIKEIKMSVILIAKKVSVLFPELTIIIIYLPTYIIP